MSAHKCICGADKGRSHLICATGWRDVSADDRIAVVTGNKKAKVRVMKAHLQASQSQDTKRERMGRL